MNAVSGRDEEVPFDVTIDGGVVDAMSGGPRSVEHLLPDLDLTGLKCPLPALRVRRALRRIPAGARLAVVCTDPLSGIDVPNAAREEGALVEASERCGETFRFRLRRV